MTNPKITAAVFTDGRRRYIEVSLPSLIKHVRGLARIVIFDDSGDTTYGRFLARLAQQNPHRDDIEIVSWEQRRGFGGTVKSAWEWLVANDCSDWIWHHEDDFIYRYVVPTSEIAAILAARPYLQQMALLRQAWNEVEISSGGIIQARPEAYLPNWDDNGNQWREHRVCFTTNPSLYRRSLLTASPWPNVERSEGVYTHQLLNEGLAEIPADAIRFGYWQGRDDLTPWVTHVGQQRSTAGTGY